MQGAPKPEVLNVKFHELPTTTKAITSHPLAKAIYGFVNCPVAMSNVCKSTRRAFLAHPKYKLFETGSLIIMKGGTNAQWMMYESDAAMAVFKQEPYFRYLFGVDIPDCIGVHIVGTDEFHLFVTPRDLITVAFEGSLPSEDHFKSVWGMAGVQDVNKLDAFIASKKPKTVYILKGQNSDSHLHVTNPFDVTSVKSLSATKVNTDVLFDALSESRVIKTHHELEMLLIAAVTSCWAHLYVMHNIQAEAREILAEALFMEACTIIAGCRSTAYTCICASQASINTLHYGQVEAANKRIMGEGDFLSFDMGGHLPSGYVADITCAYPLNGRFTARQAAIYSAVLRANLAVREQAMDGVEWSDMQNLTLRILAEELISMGVLQGEPAKLAADGAIWYFMPHGLGHFVGMNVHDCGGFKGALRMETLRCNRTLLEHMYITIEPGLYFSERFMALFREKFPTAVGKNFDSFINTPGCRIEDDVVIKKNSPVLVYSYAVPRQIAEIEMFMSRKA